MTIQLPFDNGLMWDILSLDTNKDKMLNVSEALKGSPGQISSLLHKSLDNDTPAKDVARFINQLALSGKEGVDLARSAIKEFVKYASVSPKRGALIAEIKDSKWLEGIQLTDTTSIKRQIAPPDQQLQVVHRDGSVSHIRINAVLDPLQNELNTSQNVANGVTVSNPYYGAVTLDKHHQNPNLLPNLDPRSFNTTTQTNGKELAVQLKPKDSSIPYNAEQIIQAPYTSEDNYGMPKDAFGALNMDSDLGVRKTITDVLPDILTPKDKDGVRQPSYVFVSSGHAIAGLEALSSMTRTNLAGEEEYLFDTSVYMPLGKWKSDYTRVHVASQGAQIWGDQIQKNKESFAQRGIPGAGGVAVALNGHRGDDGYFTQAG